MQHLDSLYFCNYKMSGYRSATMLQNYMINGGGQFRLFQLWLLNIEKIVPKLSHCPFDVKKRAFFRLVKWFVESTPPSRFGLFLIWTNWIGKVSP